MKFDVICTRANRASVISVPSSMLMNQFRILVLNGLEAL